MAAISLSTSFNIDRLKNGHCLLSVPTITEIFYTICVRGNSNSNSTTSSEKEQQLAFQPFVQDERKCISYGGIVLVTSDMKRDDDDVSGVKQKLSSLFPFKYEPFDRKEDNAETIKNKVNDFIKKVVMPVKCRIPGGLSRPLGWLGERLKEDFPKFNHFVNTNLTNLLLVAFFDVRLNWMHMDVSSVRDFVFNGKPRQAFSIPNVLAGARLYPAKSPSTERYLVVRFPVNRINSDFSCPPSVFITKEDDDKDYHPWGNVNDAFFDNVSGNVMYLSLCMRVNFDDNKIKTLDSGRRVYEVLPADPESCRHRSHYMYAEPVSPEKVDLKELCCRGEEFLLDSLKNRMPTKRTTIIMPKVESSLSYIANAQNADECKILPKRMFDLPMNNYAKKTEGRNTKIDEIALDMKLGIDENGVTVSAMMSGICTDSCTSHIPYTVRVDGPFCYMLSVGQRVIAVGLEQ